MANKIYKKNLVNNIPSFHFFGLVKKQIHQGTKILAPKKKTPGAPQSRLSRRLVCATECLAAATQPSSTLYKNLLHPVCTG
jgi:hypothetical protein